MGSVRICVRTRQPLSDRLICLLLLMKLPAVLCLAHSSKPEHISTSRLILTSREIAIAIESSSFVFERKSRMRRDVSCF